jgi:hypothetical protein
MLTSPTRFFAFLSLLTWLVLADAAAQDKSAAARKLESVTLGLSAKHVLNLPIYLAERHGICASSPASNWAHDY